MLIRFITITALFLAGDAVAQEPAYKRFGQIQVIEQPEVSPNGSQIAAIWNSEEGPTIVVSAFGSSDLEAILRLKYGFDRVDWITWLNEERLLVSVSQPGGRGSQTYRISRLYQIGLADKELNPVWRRPTLNPPEWISELDTNRIVSMLPDDPEHILMELWDERDNGRTLFKVDVANNKFEKLFVNAFDVNRWWTDHAGEVVMGIEYDTDYDQYHIWYRPDSKTDIKLMQTRSFDEPESFSIMSISDTEAVVMSDYKNRRESVWRFNIETGEFEEQIFSHEKYDIAGTILSNDDSELLGYYYYSDFRVDHYTDEAARQRAEVVKASFKGFRTTVVSHSQNGDQMIVALQDDNLPTRYAWLDLAKQAGGIWYTKYPYLDGQTLPDVQPIEFTSSDGLTINGYLTMPLEFEGDKPPLIVHPHGGPNSRDYQYFDPYVQYLASLGYAVLQVNFRGSEGYGSDFEFAGYREWGQAMQQDVYEAVDWLEKLNIVDTERKCMVGASYGGYVALVAAYQRPDDYECIVSIAGISDLYDMVRGEWVHRILRSDLTKSIGNPTDDDDAAMLRANSAINHLDSIKAPILMFHGTEDTRVQISQARKFDKAAEDANLDVEYIELKDGTHFLDEYQNRLDVFEKMGEFLTKHLN